MILDSYFYPLLTIILILICFSYYLYINKRKKAEKENWNNRLNQLFKPVEVEKGEAVSLIKKVDSSEFYFQSKLQRIEGLNIWLQQAGLKLSSRQFFEYCTGLGLAIFFIFFVYFKLTILNSFLICTVLTFLVSWGGISYLKNRNKELFLQEFPIALDIIRRALRAGFSTEKALEIVAEQQKGRIGIAFKAISDRMRLGENTEAILADMSNRIGINEFRLLAIVFVLQRETGGSLADSAENLSKVIRARENLRKKVKALTGEVRATAAILTCLPIVTVGLIYFTTPSYLDPLFTTEAGHYLLIIGGTLLTLGVATIIRMTHKDLY
ncbi:MAG: type II secretion system F family protein [Alphaproteobacteria bacterium]|nr:type II secretion system F family protein [Alphaproteobacteria bacterium]